VGDLAGIRPTPCFRREPTVWGQASMAKPWHLSW
jgi:hypothetical protein